MAIEQNPTGRDQQPTPFVGLVRKLAENTPFNQEVYPPAKRFGKAIKSVFRSYRPHIRSTDRESVFQGLYNAAIEVDLTTDRAQGVAGDFKQRYPNAMYGIGTLFENGKDPNFSLDRMDLRGLRFDIVNGRLAEGHIALDVDGYPKNVVDITFSQEGEPTYMLRDTQPGSLPTMYKPHTPQDQYDYLNDVLPALGELLKTPNIVNIGIDANPPRFNAGGVPFSKLLTFY